MSDPSTQPEPPTVQWSLDDYAKYARAVPQAVAGGLSLGGVFLPDDVIVAPFGHVRAMVRDISGWAARYRELLGRDNPAQLAALLFDATGDPWSLAHYFPAVMVLADVERAALFGQIAATAHHPHLDLRLIGEGRKDLTGQLPASARWIVAGHLVEVLGQRPDILAAFLGAPRHLRLYTSARAFADDGGIAGGDYDPTRERIQLGLERVFEGFGGARPGVAPFLHELGHMLDAYDVESGTMARGRGLLPGLDPRDGALFTPRRAVVSCPARPWRHGATPCWWRALALRPGLSRTPSFRSGIPTCSRMTGSFSRAILSSSSGRPIGLARSIRSSSVASPPCCGKTRVRRGRWISPIMWTRTARRIVGVAQSRPRESPCLARMTRDARAAAHARDSSGSDSSRRIS